MATLFPFAPVVNTRFNPTVNGDLHLGHLYLCLVNEHEAHSRGGKFGIRFDDAKPCTNTWANGDLDLIARYRERQLVDIAQFMTIDWATSEKEEEWRLCQIPKRFQEDWMISSPHPYPEVIQYPGGHHTGAGEYYPYVPGWTAEKVWLDAQAGVNWLIRGDDLIASPYPGTRTFPGYNHRGRGSTPSANPRAATPSEPRLPSTVKRRCFTFCGTLALLTERGRSA